MNRVAKVIFPVSLAVSVPVLCAGNELERAGMVKGRIIDSEQNTLPGAMIYVDDKSSGVISDIDGFYSISGLTPGRHTITISYVGYSPVTETVEVKSGRFNNDTQ